MQLTGARVEIPHESGQGNVEDGVVQVDDQR